MWCFLCFFAPHIPLSSLAVAAQPTRSSTAYSIAPLLNSQLCNRAILLLTLHINFLRIERSCVRNIGKPSIALRKSNTVVVCAIIIDTLSSCLTTSNRKDIVAAYHNLRRIKMLKTFRLYLLLVLVSYTSCPSRVIARELFEYTTRLDDPRFRFLFHSFRTFVFHSIGKTSHSRTKGNFLQEKFTTPFPCDVNIGRSKARPTSIHKLRPGGELICQMPNEWIFFLRLPLVHISVGFLAETFNCSGHPYISLIGYLTTCYEHVFAIKSHLCSPHRLNLSQQTS